MDSLGSTAPVAKRDAANRLAHRLSDAHCCIAASAPAGDEIGFICSTFVRYTLPHRKPPGHTFERRDGLRVITFMSPPHIGLPSGKVPRLLLIHLTTQAVRTRERDIDLCASMSSLMKLVGERVTGGAHGTVGRFKDQVLRTISMTATTSLDTADTSHLQNAPMADEFFISWTALSNDNRSGLPAKIRLGERIFNEMLTKAVPIDLRAVRAVRQSPLALDLYNWSTYRTYRMHRLPPGRPVHIPWAGLRQQFGSAYKSESDFKIAFKSALKQVQLVYPALRCEARDSHFVLHHSPTSVAAAATRRAADS